MGRFIDFDAALSEQRGEPVVVRLFGEDWKLYSSLPASVVLEVVAREESEVDFSPADLMAVGQKAIPPDVLSAWLEKGLAFEQFTTVIKAVIAAYAGVGEEDEAGEAPASTASE